MTPKSRKLGVKSSHEGEVKSLSSHVILRVKWSDSQALATPLFARDLVVPHMHNPDGLLMWATLFQTILYWNCGLTTSAFLLPFLKMIEDYLFTSDGTDLGQEHLWVSEWWLINVELQL